MSAENESVTVGMRLDAFIEQLDSLTPTQLYGVTVLSSIVFCILLLNTGGFAYTDHYPSESSPKKPVKVSVSSKKTMEPQPKWYILKVLNVFAAVTFIVSVVAFMSDASTYMSDSFSVVKFLAGWSLFLCYFFGFFGISFVDADVIERRSLTESLPKKVNEISSTSSQPAKDSPKATKKVLPPAPSTHPVCSAKEKSPKVSKAPKDLQLLTNEEIAALVVSNKIKDHTLEKLFDPYRAVDIRRLAFESKLSTIGNGGALQELPSAPSLDYGKVFGANCEIVVGYVPIPVGMVGPITLNGESVYIPMATTEGCLVASTNRGCKAISSGSGAHSVILRDGITRAPCLRMGSAMEAASLKLWCEEPANFALLKQAFESTTSFGKLKKAEPTVSGRNVYLRLTCFSGDAMGMNMVSKGSLAVVDLLREVFPNMTLVALSGNMCTDKKAAATNWIEGRGKSVVIEATISKAVVKSILKTDVKTIVSTNLQKNLIGSAMAGAVGGFNAHAANNVTAVFLATGQDPAQNVESSNCITLLEETEEGDLWISCTMPSIEVGTVGGGTSLPAQAACLKAIGCKGGGATPGANAQKLAHVVAAATMAGELSLLAALAANTLVAAHMQHNRKPASK